MSINKKSIYLTNKKILSEMPMQFQNDRDIKPSADVQNQLADRETPHKKIPYPKVDPDGVPSNFEELLASERYQDVLERVKRYTGLTNVTNGDMNSLMGQMMGAYQQIYQIEYRHRQTLEKLAIDVVCKEMGIDKNNFQWDVKIAGPGEIDTEFNTEDSGDEDFEVNLENDQEDQDLEMELFGRLKDLDIERAKRRFINAVIQGASKRGHYMYHMVAERLRQLTGSDQLLNSYGVMMSVNDLLYWVLPDQQMQAMMGGGGVGGSEEVDPNTEPPTIKVRGMCFPVLLHEIIKGIMEIMGAQGQPEDMETAEKVRDLEDVLTKEVWDMRLGPSIWNRLRQAYPDNIMTDEDKVEIQNFLFIEFVKLPAKEFLVFAKEVVSGSSKGQRLIQQLVDEIVERLEHQDDEDYDYGESNFRRDLDTMADDISDDDMDDLLSSLGISRSDDDD